MCLSCPHSCSVGVDTEKRSVRVALLNCADLFCINSNSVVGPEKKEYDLQVKVLIHASKGNVTEH